MFVDPSAAGKRSAEVRGVIGNSAWGRSMLRKGRAGNPRIHETAHPARRYKAFERRLLEELNGDWSQASEAQLDRLAFLRREWAKHGL